MSIPRKLVILLVVAMQLFAIRVIGQTDLSTDYLKIHIDGKGFITSMKNITVTPDREFSPADKPSPILCLYDSRKEVYYEPQNATYNAATKILSIKYANGSVAKVAIVSNKKYFRLTLQSVAPRAGVDDIQWGSYYTNITNLFGEVIGVARDTSDAVNYAIGGMALNDITTGGTSTNEGDAAPFQYVIHTPDKNRFPLPPSLHEGQLLPIGGD